MAELSQLNAIVQYTSQIYVISGNDGFILRTGDAGLSWVQIQTGTTENLYGFSPFGEYVVGSNGIILKGDNFGTMWTGVQTETNNDLFAISGTVAVGFEGTIVKLNSSTNIFELKSSGVNITLRGISFLDDQNGFAVGDNGTLITTSDGGETWNAATSGTINNLNAIQFAPFSSMGWIVGEGGVILSTNDSGASWNPQTSGTTENLNSISAADFNNSDVLAAGSNGNILLSTNGGANWSLQTSGVTDNLRGILNHSFDYAVGDNIAIIKSTDGGITWGLINNNITDVDYNFETMVADYHLSQNYPNPFNPSTKIVYNIPELSFVELNVYDILGNEVTSLVSEEQLAGSYSADFMANNLSSGIYFYRIQAGSFVETKKMILIK